MKKYIPLSASVLRELREEYHHIKNEVAIRPDTYVVNTENSVGDLLFESKNVYMGFDSIHVQDSRYIYDAIDLKDSMDVYHVGWAQLMYECHAISNGYNCRFCHFTYDNTNATYCDATQNCQDVFGCAGLVRKKYCILNKQYTKEEYEALVPRIIAHMKSFGEFGEFFPIQFSPFAYNQSRVQEYYPLTKEKAEAQNYRWSDFKPAPPLTNRQSLASELPEYSGDVSDDILNSAILCEITGRPFAVIAPELNFYKKNGLPLPRRHPDQRYLDRIAARAPRSLWKRPCMKCEKETWTSHEPRSLAKMYCRTCYLETVY